MSATVAAARQSDPNPTITSFANAAHTHQNAAGGGALDAAAIATGSLPVTNGGTGRATSTTAYALLAAGTTATGAQQTLGIGSITQILVGGGAAALPVWTSANGSGAPVRATSPTLVTPILGVANSTSLTIAGRGSFSGTQGGGALVLGNNIIGAPVTANKVAKDVSVGDAANLLMFRYDRGAWISTDIGAGDALGTEYDDLTNRRWGVGVNGSMGLYNLATPPASSPIDMVQVWCADSVAGKANMHTRNENGRVERQTGLGASVTTQFDKTSSTTLGNVTGLSHDVEAGRSYGFEAVLVTTSNTAGGIKAAVNGSCTATAIKYEGRAISGNAIVGQTRATALGGAVCDVTGVTAALIEIRGTITVNAAGTLDIQFSQSVASAAASSVLTLSTFRLFTIG